MLAALLAASPPRTVPPVLLRAAQRQASPLDISIIGFCIVAFCLVYGWIVFPWGIRHNWQLSGGQAAHAIGRVTAASKTGLSEGGSKYQAGTPVFAYDFTFTPSGGSETHGESYTTGSRWSAGANVEIEYLATDPAVARIAGSRTSKHTLSAIYGPAFTTLIGLFYLGFGWWVRRRTRWLLKHGALGEAVVQSVEPIGGKGMQKIILLLTTDGQDGPSIVVRRPRRMAGFFQTRLATKQPVFVLFDPAKPNRAFLT
jgi:hypothetical protein